MLWGTFPVLIAQFAGFYVKDEPNKMLDISNGGDRLLLLCYQLL